MSDKTSLALSIRRELEDDCALLAWARTREVFDTRIFVWGTSFAGGRRPDLRWPRRCGPRAVSCTAAAAGITTSTPAGSIIRTCGKSRWSFYAGTPARRNAVTHSSLLPSLSKRHGKYCSTGLIDTKGSDIWLLRLQALQARADGDDPAYAHLRGRYRDMARTLGYERHIAWAEAMP